MPPGPGPHPPAVPFSDTEFHLDPSVSTDDSPQEGTTAAPTFEQLNARGLIELRPATTEPEYGASAITDEAEDIADDDLFGDGILNTSDVSESVQLPVQVSEGGQSDPQPMSMEVAANSQEVTGESLMMDVTGESLMVDATNILSQAPPIDMLDLHAEIDSD